jgi:lipid-binding SYLF domain-containing protein
MNTIRVLLMSLLLTLSTVYADDYKDAIKVFKDAGASDNFFSKSYGYAIFPRVAKAGFIVGGAYGTGRVYRDNYYVGNTAITQGSLGFQMGAQAFSQIIFFEDKRAFDEFTSGNFEFGADANVVAITAGASAQTTTTGTSAGASGGKSNASTVSTNYYKGMAVFSVAEGGLMFQAAISGQKFSYTSK